MGTIIVGQKNPKRVVSNGFTSLSPSANAAGTAKKEMSEEEKAKLMENIMQLPKDKWVSALRNAGLESEAVDCEKFLEEERKHQEYEKRMARLAEIKAMDESEQLPLLLEEGFDDEARELSEKLASETRVSSETSEADATDTTDTDDTTGDGDESQVQQDPAATDDAETSEAEKPAEKESKAKSSTKNTTKKNK